MAVVRTRSETVHLIPAALAQRWGVSVGHLANRRSDGQEPSYLKLGKRVVYRLADIEAYEARCLVKSLR